MIDTSDFSIFTHHVDLVVGLNKQDCLSFAIETGGVTAQIHTNIKKKADIDSLCESLKHFKIHLPD